MCIQEKNIDDINNNNNSSSNNVDLTCKEKLDNMQSDYDVLYASNLETYQECTGRLENTQNLYDNELEVTEFVMGKLDECESKLLNFSGISNGTERIYLLKDNIRLDALVRRLEKTLKEKTQLWEDKIKVSYSLIDDCTEKNINLTSQVKGLIEKVSEIQNNFDACDKELTTQLNAGIKNLKSLRSCIESEEECQDQKNKFVLRLGTCRKNNRKNKQKIEKKPTEKIIET